MEDEMTMLDFSEHIAEDARKRAIELCKITIGSVDAAPAPHMPSHLFPGCGTSGAKFKVTDGPIPSQDTMAQLLRDWDTDALLARYDCEQGTGYFCMVDWPTPEAGTVISLPAIHPY